MKRLADILLGDLDKKNIVLTSTLLFLALHASGYRHVQLPVTIICSAGIIFPALKNSKYLWAAIILAYTVGNIALYFELVNHKFLYLYWCIAIFACLFSPDFEKAARFNAALLIGLVFAIATLQKLFSADYMDGSFILYILVKDERVGNFLSMFHLLPKEMVEQNIRAASRLVNDAAYPYEASLAYTVAAKHFSLILTWLTVIIEAVLAILFLLPRRFSITKYRDYIMWLFLFFGYMIAPIGGFGSVLALMGMAQAETKKRELIYILLFLLVQIYGVELYKIIQFFARLFS
ncbi:MAG: hypothetical protein QM791_04885 [Ferruginibacter sp.]